MSLPLGRTGLTVSQVGLGGGALGSLDQAAASRLLDAARDLGITLVDTARSYGGSEARLGAWHARGGRGLLVSTKGGYGVRGVEDWTAAAVTRGIDEARATLRLDTLPVFSLHSCPRAVLARGDVGRALHEAVREGKVRAAGYSGDDEALEHALADGGFPIVELSLSPLDQRVVPRGLAKAQALGAGVIVKRALANAPWRFAEQPPEPDLAEHWRRWRALDLAQLCADLGLAPDALCLRYAAFAPGVTAVLLGTTRVEGLARAVACVADGPLSDDVISVLAARFAALGEPWPAVT